ncbi:asparagine synthetase B [Alteromonas sp. C1M14]|uniref:asparagine synthetase B family protein n=1 Tax=Alteromonas sp. C1M14 TaxID=2841567 RepID=UPI001C082FCE|nr:asparagine synthetase B [Alteromonas sp. C1M14]MBU2978908.1 asparagine synthetase B [Alteromonas sp. C1M14]
MCGLVVLAGKQAEILIPECIERIKHRGPDELVVLTENEFAIGFRRLAINGTADNGRQPFEHKGWLGGINGEIYNFSDLAYRYQLKSHECDTSVVLPLYLQLKENVIEELDGFYSAVLIEPDRIHAICLRDAMGKKPLYVGSSQGEIFISSELKAFKSIDWFEAIPKGVAKICLKTGAVTLVKSFSSFQSTLCIKQALIESVRKRLPNHKQAVAIFLSGGLDSSLIASIASKLRDNIVYFTLGNADGDDLSAAHIVTQYLGLKNVVEIPLPMIAELPSLINQVVYATESYNPSVISNGLATFLLAKAANQVGIKVALTGEGADELFGGYHSFSEVEPWKATRDQLIRDMTFTELRRLDMACMANSVEPRCPFLDREVKALSDTLCYDELYSNGVNKATLRTIFDDFLPSNILLRKKVSCDVGSGIRGMVVNYLKRNGRRERDELLDIWKQHFQFDHSDDYFHSYPVFDSAINARGKRHR